jgi:hypothetical protein
MGRHAAADDVDDEALAAEPSRPGAHRADTGPADTGGSAAAAPTKPGRRAAVKKPATPKGGTT